MDWVLAGGKAIAQRARLNPEGTWALVVFISCLALYVPTLSPSIVNGDNGELQMVAYVLGVPHRTGYPLFLLLGWLVTHLPIGGDVAFRLTLLTMMIAASAVTVFYYLLRELGVRQVVALFAALVLASMPRLWMHATAAEVYPLAVLFTLLGSLLLLRWGRGTSPLWLVTLVFGLALTHHISIRLLGPAVLVYLLLVEPRLPLRPGEWLPALGTLLAPLALYALIPLRANAFMSMPQWQGEILGVLKVVASGFVSPWYTADGFFGFVTVSGYSGQVLSGAGLGSDVVSQFLEGVKRQFPVIVVAPLALLGVGAMAIQRKRAAVYFVLAYLVTTWAALRFLGEVGGGGNQLITAYALTVVWFALGVETVLRRLSDRWELVGWKMAIAILLLACVPLYNTWVQYPDALARRQLNTRSEAEAILELPLEDGAVVAGPWADTTPLRYLQRVDGVRPDLWIVHADEAGIGQRLLPEALVTETPFYALRSTAAGLRLLPLPPTGTVEIAHPAALVLGGLARWRGYDLPGRPVAPGSAVPITLYWSAETQIEQNWKTFIHLLDEQGEKVAQVDRVPLEFLYPPTEWQPGRLMVDQYELLLPSDLPAGKYQLVFGGYDDNGRLVWEDGQDVQEMAEVLIQP